MSYITEEIENIDYKIEQLKLEKSKLIENKLFSASEQIKKILIDFGLYLDVEYDDTAVYLIDKTTNKKLVISC